MSSSSTGQVISSAAEVYDAFFVPALFSQFCAPVLDAARIGPGDVVLDVGCGTGVLAAAAAERVGDSGAVTGIDLNPGMLAVAARTRPRVTWQHADGQQLPFEDGSYDAVVSQFALMFMPDPVAALREAARVTRPDGRLAMAVWGELDASPGYQQLAQLLDRVLGSQAREALAAPFALGEPAALRRCATAAGLAAEVTAHPGVARFPSLDRWIDTELRGWTLADSVDDAVVARVQATARDELQEHVQPDGSVAFAVTALVVEAAKAGSAA